MRHVKYCKLCGNKIWMQGYDTENRFAYIMAQKCICYECAYWEDLIAYPPQYLEVVKNQCVRLHPVANNKDKTLILGGKGKKKYFLRSDGTLIETNDIWVIGTIPDRFASRLPITAVEISIKAFRQLSRTNRKCQARGCFDRYHCLRYNLALENDERGPFNTVPPKWRVGDEHCRYFIHLQEVNI